MANTIAGTKGNDTFDSYSTNDVYDGDTGSDTMIYSIARSNFTIMRTAEGHSLTDLSGTAGKDVLQNMEQIKFSDTTLDVEYYDVVQQLYVAYYGRATDSGAIVNFASLLRSYGAPTDIQSLSTAYFTNTQIRDLINTFGTSTESSNLYSGDTTAFVTAIFQNVLGRAPQSSGLTFWSNAIDNEGLTRANAALSIMAGALANTTTQGVLDAALINNKIRVASNFTFAIDTASEVAAYSGSAAAASVRSMLSNVTSSTDIDVFQTTVTSTLATMTAARSATPQFIAEEGDIAQLVGVAPNVDLFA